MNDNIEIEINLKNDPIEMEIESNNSIIIREENVIESISVNGVEQPVDENKNVDITVPTKISDLNNDNNTVQDANYVHTDNNFTTQEKTKLANLENYDDTEIKADIQELDTNKANKSETYTKTETDTLLQDKADTEDIPDVSGFITKDVNNLTNYTLKTNTGSLIDLEINSTTYVVTLRLKDIDGNVISTDTIDLPLESVVVSGRYDNTTKKVILTLENGSEVDFSVADLVAGLQTEITSTNKLASDLVDDTNSGNKFVTTSEKQIWNNKYDKPSGGIPKTDLASAVQTSLGKADTALQTHQDISGKEDKSSKVTEINETNTDTQYPSAKAVQDKMANLGTTKTTSGTSIDITDSAEGNMPLGIKGNTSQQTYTGKNKFHISNATPVDANTRYNKISDNEIEVTTKNPAAYRYVSIPVEVEANTTYYFKANIKNSNSDVTSLWFAVLNSDNSQTILNGAYSDSQEKSFNTGENTVVNLSLYATRNLAALNTATWSNIQLTKNSNDTYEPYVGGKASPNPEYPQEVKTVTGEVNVKVANGIDNTAEGYQEQNYPINLGTLELCKIGDYQDYIHKDNGKWYKHKEIEKVVLDGSESGWIYTDNRGSYYRYYMPNFTTGLTLGIHSIITNYFIDRGNQPIGEYNFAQLSANDLYIQIENITTLGEFKTWLSTHNTEVYYVLATPIEEEITEPTLIAQLEAIYNNAKSYEGETHIFTITENESPYIEAEYSIDNIENTVNKVTSIDENSTNKQYPSAKAVVDYINDNFTPSEVELPIDYNAVYDTEEHQVGYYKVTGGYKPLYRKKETFTTTSNAFTYTIYTPNINNIEEIVSILSQSYLIDNQNENRYPLNAVRMATDTNILGNYSNWFRINFEPIGIAYLIGTATTNSTCVLFLEYTKTTDTVLTEIPKQTIPSVVQKEGEVYSTEEQVIGTWFGKPLYRKVVIISSLPNATFVQYPSTIQNLETLINIYGVTSNGLVLNGNREDASYEIGAWYNSINNTIGISTKTDRSSIGANVILEYTKTTDV